MPRGSALVYYSECEPHCSTAKKYREFLSISNICLKFILEYSWIHSSDVIFGVEKEKRSEGSKEKWIDEGRNKKKPCARTLNFYLPIFQDDNLNCEDEFEQPLWYEFEHAINRKKKTTYARQSEPNFNETINF